MKNSRTYLLLSERPFFTFIFFGNICSCACWNERCVFLAYMFHVSSEKLLPLPFLHNVAASLCPGPPQQHTGFPPLFGRRSAAKATALNPASQAERGTTPWPYTRTPWCSTSGREITAMWPPTRWCPWVARVFGLKSCKAKRTLKLNGSSGVFLVIDTIGVLIVM